jgi:N-acetylmuramoyl-L-alanine amidase
MLSESARMTTAAEAKFRIDAPNSKPRAVKVIALDPRSEDVVKRLAKADWNKASFFTSVHFDSPPQAGADWSVKAWLNDLAGRTSKLVDEINTADLVVMVASAGSKAEAASVIGEACGLKRVMTTALVLGRASASDQALSGTLLHLRPHASMVVVADDEDYIESMLVALRA